MGIGNFFWKRCEKIRILFNFAIGEHAAIFNPASCTTLISNLQPLPYKLHSVLYCNRAPGLILINWGKPKQLVLEDFSAGVYFDVDLTKYTDVSPDKNNAYNSRPTLLSSTPHNLRGRKDGSSMLQSDYIRHPSSDTGA